MLISTESEIFQHFKTTRISYKQGLNTLLVTVLIYPCADNILVVYALKLVIQYLVDLLESLPIEVDEQTSLHALH